jgi:hypothetical protein
MTVWAGAVAEWWAGSHSEIYGRAHERVLPGATPNQVWCDQLAEDGEGGDERQFPPARPGAAVEHADEDADPDAGDDGRAADLHRSAEHASLLPCGLPDAGILL